MCAAFTAPWLTIIAERFFTAEGGGGAEALVKTYAPFALAFFLRPVGAALFGRQGDRVGRCPVPAPVRSQRVTDLMSGTWCWSRSAWWAGRTTANCARP